MPFLFLTEADVRAVLPPSEYPALVDRMEAALVDFSAGRVTQPIRTAVAIGPPGQYLGLMPALVPAASALGAKLVSVVPDNATRNLSSHIGIVVLFDTVNGALRAVMDARYITEVRTPAVSAVSVRHLARRDATRLGIIGAGVQARSHLEVFSRVNRLTEVRVWGPDRSQVETVAREMSAGLGLPVHAAPAAEAAVRDADLIVLATASATPVIENDWVSPGTHVVSVGACRPDQQEMDRALLGRAYLVVDSREAALAESGDIVGAIAAGAFGPSHVAGELGDVAAGRVAGRTSDEQVTIFKSLGLAVEDVSTAALVLERATSRHLGRELAL